MDARIAECSWEYLSTLRTVAEPHEPMPRLRDFLEWLTQPELEKIWVVLDIKVGISAYIVARKLMQAYTA